MKKIFYFITALAVMGSCTQEEIVNGNFRGDESGVNFLHSDLGGSRLSIADEKVDGKFPLQWTAGDAFTAFEGNTAYAYSLTNGEGTANGTFKGEGAPTCAVFPATAKAAKVDKKIDIELTQIFNKGDNSLNTPMYGGITNGNVKFSKKLTALLKVKYTDLPSGYNILRVESDVQPLSGKFTFSTDKFLLSPVANATKKSVLVKHDNNTDAFYVPIPAGTYDGLTFYVENETTQHRIMLITLLYKKFEVGQMYTLNRKYNTIISKFDSSNFMADMTSHADVHSKAKGKWFGMKKDTNGSNSIDNEAGALKLDNTKGDLYYNMEVGCAGGYCLEKALPNGIYKVTLESKSKNLTNAEAKNPYEQTRLKFGAVANEDPSGVKDKGGLYLIGLSSKEAVDPTKPKYAIQTLQHKNDGAWCLNSFYINNGYWVEKGKDFAKFQVVNTAGLFDIRFFPAFKNTIWLKEIQISEVVDFSNK